MLYPLSWRDCPFVWEQDGPGIPAMAQVGSSAMHARRWQLNDRLYGAAHIQHDYVPGTPVFDHIHYFTDGVSLLPVRWRWRLWHAKGHDQAAFDFDGAPTTVEVDSVPGGKYRHMIPETGAITIPGLEPDSFVLGVIDRITNGATDNADKVFAWCSDIHHQITIAGTTNRQPPFYTESP